ncbi:hypothetical protein [Sphingomonas aracearum]|uniref:hypothetical protein n=1 Tax=Sphingomonas aracearum TaxID=2283317 RepID=UPI0011C06EA4|nr:hypothetical protein [Sphingomonas aracearum]
MSAAGAPELVGDTVSPINVSISAVCKTNSIRITYRNSWIDGTGPVGLRKVEVNGRDAPEALSAITRIIKNARIDRLSFLHCFADRNIFNIYIKIDSSDVRRLNLKEIYVLAVDQRSAEET